MKTLVYSLLALVLFACSTGETPEATPAVDTIAVDTIAVALPADTATLPEPIAVDSATLAFQQFMENPLNLVDYKNAKMGSNSSVAQNNAHYFRPDSVGFYYRYMLFTPYQRPKVSQRIDEGDLFHNGVNIITYMYGKVVGRFHDHNEMLISFRSRYNDSDLGQADLVGKSREDIIDLLGEPPIEEGTLLIYHYNNNALALSMEDGNVVQFKYVKLNQPLTPDNIPEVVTTY